MARRKTLGLENPDQVRHIVQSLFPCVESFSKEDRDSCPVRCEDFILKELKRSGRSLKPITSSGTGRSRGWSVVFWFDFSVSDYEIMYFIILYYVRLFLMNVISIQMCIILWLYVSVYVSNKKVSAKEKRKRTQILKFFHGSALNFSRTVP